MSKIPTRNIDPRCPKCSKPRQPHLSYCRDCRNEKKRDARRRKREGSPNLKTGRKVVLECPRCPRPNPKPKLIKASGKMGSYCEECNRAVNREAKKVHLARKGRSVRVVSINSRASQASLLSRDNPNNARPQNNHGGGAGMEVKRRPPGNHQLCRNEAVACAVDAEKLRTARLERIKRDGPGNYDSPEDMAASGWEKPANWLERIARRYAR